MLYEKAKELAEQLKALIEPGCMRIEPVGSVKRGDRAEVHDIKILCIADETRGKLEFGKKIPTIRFYQVLEELCDKGLLKFAMGQNRLRKYEILGLGLINPFYLELYIVRPETWGIQNVIRTGPALFSHAFVTQRSQTFYDEQSSAHYYGLLPDDLLYVRGETKIVSNGSALLLPEEVDALSLIGYGWVEPQDRSKLVRHA